MTKWMKANISRFLGMLHGQLMDIFYDKYKKTGKTDEYQKFLDKCKVENFDELDEETYDLIKQAIKEYNKKGDIKKDFVEKFGIEAWDDMKVKY